MSKLKSKLARRIMAIVLSGAMVMSSMTTSGISAYAAESATEKTSEVETGKEVRGGDEGAEEAPEKAENLAVEGEDESEPDTSNNQGDGESEPDTSNNQGDGESEPDTSNNQGDGESKPAESAPGSSVEETTPDEGSSDEGSSDEGSSDEGSSDEGSSDEGSSEPEMEAEPETTYIFEAKNLTSVNSSADGDVTQLTDDGYFELVARKDKPGVESHPDEFEDGYVPEKRLKFGGAWTSSGNWIQFTTKNSIGTSKIKVWWNTSAAGRSVALYDSAMNELDNGGETTAAGNYITTFTVTKAGEYRIASSLSIGKAADIRISKIEVTDGAAIPITFDAAQIFTGPISANNWTDGETESYENDFFTILYSATAKVEAKSYVDSGYWDDGYTGGYRISFGGTASTTKNAIKFTTKRDEATIKLWWKAGADGRHVQILDADGNVVSVSTETSQKDASYITKFKLTSKGTYYIGNETGNNYIFKLSVTDGHVDDPVAWDTVDAPVITSAVQNKGNIDVSFTAYIDEIQGCEKVTVYMYDTNPAENEDAKPINSVSSSKTTTSASGAITVSFTPKTSGTYYFIAKASRAEEGENNTHDSDPYEMTEAFILPLATPSISRATNKGSGSMEIAYNSIDEAVKYVASAVQVEQSEDADGKEIYNEIEGAEPIIVESETTTATIPGLTVGEYYAFTVYAYRGEEDISATSAPFYGLVKNASEQIWDYSAYGVSTSITGKTTNVDGETVIKDAYSGNVNDGEVRVWSLDGSGKIVPGSSEDGLSFVYTTVDKDTNFTLEATAHVNSWTYSNGQEGFGLMMADSVGENGFSGTFWNNTYMAVATKMEYYWDGATILSSEVGPAEGRTRYNMYLGIGSLVRSGVTDAWKDEQANGATTPSLFSASSMSLEHGAPTAGMDGSNSDGYNVIGNHWAGSATKKSMDVEPLLTDIKLRIQKNNTGYFITYIDANGNETTNKYYDSAIYEKDYANQNLLQIDKENIYVGFFAARNADVTFSNINFETISVDDDEAPEETPITYNIPTYTIPCATVTNSDEYELQFSSSWQGTLSIKDAAGNELVNENLYKYLAKQPTTVLGTLGYEDTNMFDKFFTYEYIYDGYVEDEDGNKIPNYTLDEDGNKIVDYDTVKLKANVKALIPIVDDVKDTEGNVVTEGINQASLLAVGANMFTYTFTPDRDWHLNDDEKQQLSSYDTFVQTLTVNYRKYGQDESNIYVSPTGKATADGTQDAPLDIYTAVKYVQAGQTIVLMDGTYNLKSSLTIERGIDGTADKPIRMVTQNTVNRSNPWEKSSVIIDFNGVASGMTIAGDYWYFRGFDVTNSSDGNKGIQVSGSHNVLDQVNAYYNGNTGIQLSRYKGTDIDKSDDWPSYNTILNCTSYLNADSGFEDADGFAAKLTIGDGNVFDGCIAAYNADDGWDLYAKAESGKIGQVIIQNSVAFKNGYVLWDNNGKLDINATNEIDAGNGNGFKMGGEGIKGHHMLLNSYSFLNKANGIESNSCPDIQVFNSLSLNNTHWDEENEKYVGANIALYGRTGTTTATEFRAYNVISIRTEDGAAENLGGLGTNENQDYENASTFYWKGDLNKAANKNNVVITAEDFKDVTFDGLSAITRNANGTINMGDFLVLKDSVDTSYFVDLKKATLTDPDGITYDTYVVAEDDDSDLPGAPAIGGTETNDQDAAVDTEKDTDGSVDKNDDTDNASSDIWTDEEFAQLDTSGNSLKILLDLDYDKDGNYYVDYTGTAIKPAVRVAYGTTELSTKNYSVSYKNNTKAYELLPGDSGFDAKLAPTVIIKGKGNYAGQYSLYFTIKKIDMGSSDKVVSANIATVATGKSQKIKPAVTFNGKTLGTKEYTVSAPYTKTIVTDENTGKTTETITPYTGSYESAGTYYIDLVGADANFTGTKTITVNVLSDADVAGKTSMSKVKVAKIPDQIYDGTAHRPAVSVTGLTASTTDSEGNFVQGDYDVAYYNNTDIGVASVVLTGNLEKGYYGTKTVTFKTVAKAFNIKDYSVTVKYGDKYYTSNDEYKSLSIPSTGSAVTFGNVVVKVIANEGSEDKTLTEGVDYTVSYKGNNKAGKASIIVKGMGDFKGSMTRTFTITPLEINSSNTTVTVADQEYAKGGVKPSVVVKVNGKTISSSYYNVSYKNNNKISTDSLKASVSITGKNLLKGTVKDVATFNVNPKNLSRLTVSADDVYYGTAKTAGDGIKYATKLAVSDSNGKKLSLKSDYDVNYYYYNNENVYTKLDKNDKIPYNSVNTTIYVEVVPGTKGFYSGTLRTTYNVVGKNDIKTAKIDKITDTYAYNDTAVAVPTDKLVVKIQNRSLKDGKYVKDSEYTTLTLNTDYKIVNIKNNDRFGTATVTLQGMGNYCGTNKATFKITKKELSSWNYYLAYAIVNKITVNIDEEDVANYAEKGITFENLLNTAIKITDASGTALTYGTHFTATTYTNNAINAASLETTKEATVTIKGISPYTGSKTISFTIRGKNAEPEMPPEIPPVDPSETDPSEAPSETDPSEAPSETDPSEAPSETETSEAPSETETSETPSETETSEAPSETESSEASSETETSEAPSETETSEAPSETESSEESFSTESSSDEGSSETQTETTEDLEDNTSSGSSFAQWFRSLFSFR